LFILFRRRAAFPVVIRGWLPKKLFARIPNSPPPESLLIIYILVFLGIHTLSRAIFFSPRYLLPLFPALTIVAGRGLDELWHSRYRSVKAIAVILFLILLSLGLINHLGYIRPPTITEDVDIAERKIENLQTSGRTVRAIIEYLKSREAYHVHCSYFLQWRIIFESRESIIASSRQFSVTPSRFPEYDRRVAEADRVAIIFHRDSFQHGKFRRSVYGRGREGEEINEYIVYILNRPGGGQSGP